MLTPAPQSPDDRGKRWLYAQVQAILAANAVALTPPGAEGSPSCSWGTDLETDTTLYLRLAGHPEPRALHLSRALRRGTVGEASTGNHVYSSDAHENGDPVRLVQHFVSPL
jgi:hypothetical protein